MVSLSKFGLEELPLRAIPREKTLVGAAQFPAIPMAKTINNRSN
jgi:hypothetical protein